MRALLASLFLLFACGDDAASDAGFADAEAEDDAGLADAVVSDAALADAEASDAMDFATCEGECATTDAVADFAGVVEAFDSAYFGFELDGTMRVEIYGGAAAGCPAMDSPTPDRTLVIPAISPPTDSTPQEVGATLLDFEGTLTTEPLLPASAASVTPVAASLEPRASAFVRFEFAATFEGGMVSGPVYATHCASLDG